MPAELAGARLPCWHPELPLMLQHRPSGTDWVSKTDTRLACWLPNLAML